jgi:hypothetical protein
METWVIIEDKLAYEQGFVIWSLKVQSHVARLVLACQWLSWEKRLELEIKNQYRIFLLHKNK